MIKVKELQQLVDHLTETKADPEGFVYIVADKEMRDYTEEADTLIHHNVGHGDGRETRVWILKKGRTK